ncbi:MAG: hypothetical protein GC154_09185 [bacterium]|nr:hypothetical protein [bacterium]
MRLSITRAALTLSLFCLFVGTSYAYRTKNDFSPANKPEFELLASSESHALIRYTRLEDPSYANRESSIYVGVPVGATVEVQAVGWNFTVDGRDGRSVPYIKEENNPASSDDGAELLKDAIETARKQFQELDILDVSVKPSSDAPNSATEPAYKRDKVNLAWVVFDVRWTENGAPAPSQRSSLDAGYSRLFREMCINGADTPGLRRKRSISDEDAAAGFAPAVLQYDENAPAPGWIEKDPAPRTDGVRVLTSGAGVVAVRPIDLKKQGLDPAVVKLDEVRVWLRGVQQPAAVQDENGDGVLNQKDAVYFFSKASDSAFTQYSQYFLTWSPNPEPPLRIEPQEARAAQSGEEIVRSSLEKGGDKILVKKGLRSFDWYAIQMKEQDTVIPLALTGIAPQGDIVIKIDTYNKMRDLPGFTLELAGEKKYFHARPEEATTAVFVVPASGVAENATLAVRLDKKPEPVDELAAGGSDKVGDIPHLFFDRLTVDYPRTVSLLQTPIVVESGENRPAAFQLGVARLTTRVSASVFAVKDEQLSGWLRLPVMQKDEPVQAPGGDWDFLVIERDDRVPRPYTVDLDYPSSLHRADQGANYLVIAYHKLLESARVLAQHRADEGFSVQLIDVQDIYDEFNYGYPDFDAIKRFLQYAQSRWTGLSPEFVVFVGDSSWDHRDNEGGGMTDQIPTYAPLNDPQRFASDEYYGMLWGAGDDYYYDVILGRISVRTPQEVSNYIQKVLTYEYDAPVGPWKARNLFISDDSFERYAAEQARDSVPPFIENAFIDQIEYPEVTNPYLYHRFVHDDSPEAKEYTNKKYCPECTLSILDHMNQGMLLMQYIGHGGNQLWSHERIFYGTERPTSNVLELQPNDRFPFILSWSCLTGLLNYNRPPFHVCLSEELMRYPDRGGIAVWGPSGGGTTDQHMILSHTLMRLLFEDGVTRLGEATTFCKTEFMQTYTNTDLVDQYILFGDPAVEINQPEEHLNVSVDQPYYYADEEQQFAVSADDITFTTGMAIVSMSDGHETVYESKPFVFDSLPIRHTFTGQASNLNASTAAIRVYAWNESRRADAWGAVTLPLYEPQIEISGGAASRDGSETVVVFQAANPTRFPVHQAECKLRIDSGETQYVSIADIPAESTVDVEWRGEIPEGSRFAFVRMEDDPYLGLKSVRGKDSLRVMLDQPDYPVTPLTGAVSFNTNDLIEGSSVRMRLPFVNTGDSGPASLNAWLTGPGAADAVQSVTLEPNVDKSLDFIVQLPEEAGTASYVLNVTAEGGYAKEFPMAFEVLGKPDLALAEGDLVIKPDRPEVGHTVYFKTNVYNVGDGSADDVRVEAFLGDPAEKKRLLPFHKSQRSVIDRLEPGERKEIELVWDPDAYDGLGANQISIVVDPNDGIKELDETNNRITTSVNLAGLPDLQVDAWLDHSMELGDPKPIPIWGDPLLIHARTRNMGDSDATYVRLSLMLNQNELIHFFDRVPRNVVAETEFETPLVSSKNTLSIEVDKYDLIAEKDEESGENNNASLVKRLDVKLQMPAAPIVNRERVYSVTDQDHFTAGEMEFLTFDEKLEGLVLIPGVMEFRQRVAPAFVANQDLFGLSSSSDKWMWFTRFNLFVTPTGKDTVLQASLPTPQGVYNTSVRLYSSAYDKGESAKIAVKTANDQEYKIIEHVKDGGDDGFYSLGAQRLLSDYFTIDFKAVPGPYSTSVSDVRFIRAPGAPVSALYISPLYPAEGSGGKPAVITWDADIPETASLQLWGRWVMRQPDGSLQYFPWAKKTEGAEGEMRISGQGDYLQFQAQFGLTGADFVSPVMRDVEIRIPAREARAR